MFVYIIHSSSLSKYYVGHSSNLDDRLKRHNERRSKATKSGFPWNLVWSKQCMTRSEAMRLEKKIKKRGAARYLNDIRGVA